MEADLSAHGRSKDAQKHRTTTPAAIFVIAGALVTTCYMLLDLVGDNISTFESNRHAQPAHFYLVAVATVSNAALAARLNLLAELEVRLEKAIFVCVILTGPSFSPQSSLQLLPGAES